MARNGGGAIVIEGLLAEGDWLDDAKRLADAARSLNGASRRIGGQLRATAAGYISAVSKTVRAVEGLRDEQLLTFGDTAAAWEEARSRMNALSASLGALKRGLRDAFVPIMTAAAPALTTLTNLLAQAVNGIGAFMAALTGQDAFIRATGDQREYAGSLRGSTRAAKALKRQLASFDELDILKDTDGHSGGGGAISGALSEMSGQLALLPMDEGVLRFARQLKALFEDGDYEGVGRAIAGGLNGAIEKARSLVRWERVGEGLTKAIDGVCAAFNGLVDGIHWTSVGGALGDGIDTLLRSANRLLGGIRFAGLGTALGEALNGAVAEIDFAVLGETLSRLLTAKLVVLANAVGTFDWRQFGGKLAEGMGSLVRTMGETLSEIDWSGLSLSLVGGLNAFIAQTDWAAVGGFAGERLSDALGALRTAVTAFDWGSAGDALSGAVNALVKKVDWVALGQWLDRTIKGVLDFGIRFLQGFDAEEFAAGLGKALDQVDWEGIARKLWTLLSEAVGKLGGIGRLLGLGGGLEGLGLGGSKAPVEAEVGVRLVKDGWNSLSGFVGTAVRVATSLDKGNWTSISDFVGDFVEVQTELVKKGWSSLQSFVGDRMTALVSLSRNGWKSLAGFVGDSLTVRTGLQKDGWTSIQSFVGDSMSVRTALQKDGWTSIEEFVGEFTSVKTSLTRWGWTTLSGFIGDSLSVLTSLVKSGWSSIENFVGDSLSVWTELEKWGWDSLEDFVGEDLTVWTSLARWNWDSLEDYVGDSLTVWTALKKDGWTTLQEYVGSTVKAKVQLVVDKANSVTAKIAEIFNLASGGAVTAGGSVRAFAGGGIIRGGAMRALERAPHYASGTTRAHGTVFVAGEAGPEIMGHINGRTEILNRSQIAQAIYSAVVSGMGAAVNALGRFLGNQMVSCTNAIVATLGNVGSLAAVSGIEYYAPAMATGGILPYDVSAQIAKSTAALQGTLDANNEDLIQAIVSVAGQIIAAIQAQPKPASNGGNSLSAEQVINEINRRTQMFSQSPLVGV